MGEMAIGSADAPVTIIEYASATCPHCARFHEGTYKQLKTEFIDTGTHGVLSDDAPQALAGAIAGMAADPQGCARMAEAALARLKTDFGMEPGIARLSERLNAMCRDQ